jgi:hypothetical protein
MSRLAAFASVAAVVACTAFVTPAHADATARPKTAAVTHYRTLEKMLRRFSSQAGAAKRTTIYAAR